MRFGIVQKILVSILVANLALASVLMFAGVLNLRKLAKTDLDSHMALADEQARLRLEHLVEIAYSVLSRYQQMESQEVLSSDSAKRAAYEELRAMRYDDGRGYFWVNSAEPGMPTMKMHPTRPALEGKKLDLPEFNCALGRKENLFVAMVQVSEKSGSGWVDYVWPDPKNPSQTLPKLSYVKRFRPWSVIVGTGIYIDELDKIRERETALAERIQNRMVVETVGLGLGVMVLVFLVSWVLVRTIQKRVARVAAKMEEIAAGNGDLSQRVRDASMDELGDMSRSFDRFLDTLAEIVGNMRSGVHDLQEISIHIGNRSGKVSEAIRAATDEALSAESSSQRTSEKAQAMSESVQGLERDTSSADRAVVQISRSITEASDGAAKESALAADAKRGAEDASRAVKALSQVMGEIGKITATIDDIAAQTNLLALNATIEAASAGEAGKGFAVVAGEVKDLARQTGLATADISEKVQLVQERMDEASSAIAKVLDVVASLDQLSLGIKELLVSQGQIVSGVSGDVAGVRERSERIAASVDAAMRELVTIADTIAKAGGASRMASDLSGQFLQDSQGLRDVAGRLEGMVRKFRT